MRLPVTFLGLCLTSLLTSARADTIHLKNGRTILADHVRENGNRYEYEVGDDTYAVPKSSVDRIEAGGMPAHSVGGGKAADLAGFTPNNSLANEGDLVGKIIKEGKVNPEGLASLESKGNAELSATADFIAGKFEFDHGNIAQATQYFDKALRFQPDNSTILVYYAATLVRTGNASQAVSYSQRLSANRTWNRNSPRGRVSISPFTTRASRPPKRFAGRSLLHWNPTTTIWSGISALLPMTIFS